MPRWRARDYNRSVRGRGYQVPFGRTRFCAPQTDATPRAALAPIGAACYAARRFLEAAAWGVVGFPFCVKNSAMRNRRARRASGSEMLAT